MKKFLRLAVVTMFALYGQALQAQIIIQDNNLFKTEDQMLLANEMFKSGEPFAEYLGFNLDLLDPMVLNSPDTISYTLGIENYEYSRYLLNTLTGRSSLGLHIMWSPIVKENAAMQNINTFDGSFTGGVANGYNEDDMLMMMIGNFSANANQTAPANAFPQFADFISGDNNLPQTVAADFQMDFGSTRWNRGTMDKTLNIAAMGQSILKQYYWAQDMLSAFHDINDVGVIANGTNSPDLLGSADIDASTGLFYGGNNLDGYTGQVLTAAGINKTKLLITQLAYNGTTLGMVDPATYNPINGIQYFPTKIAVTEGMLATGLPPTATAFQVTDATSQLFGQLSFLLGTVNFRNMMNPNNSSDAAHFAYHEVFDGNPFPADMATTGVAGPFDLMSGASKVIFLNIMAMHYNTTVGTFVDASSLDGSGNVVMGNTISAKNAAYIILSLSELSTEFLGTSLQTMADPAIIAQADFIINNMKDVSGGFNNSYVIGTGVSTTAKTLEANANIVMGLYAAYKSTNNSTYLTEANAAYNYVINNYYIPNQTAFRTTENDNVAVYTPTVLAAISAMFREASIMGNQANAPSIYARVFKTVFNKMIICEAEASGEVGNDSDGDGVPYIAGGTKPFVFASQGTLSLTPTSVTSLHNKVMDITVFPNPASDKISVQLNMEYQANVNISIFDISGKLVLSLNNEVDRGLQTLSVPVSTIVSGNYMLRTSIENLPVSVERIIIK